MVDEGAILTLPGVPLIRHLVVEVQWLSDFQAVFLCLDDDLTLRAEYARFERLGVHSFGVSLERGADVIAALTTIEKAAAPNPEEYRNLLERWRESGAKIPVAGTHRAGSGLAVGGGRPRSFPLAASL